MDCLLTMFNILLIIAGILEYVLLGINFHVRRTSPFINTITITITPQLQIGKLPKHIPRRNPHSSRLPKRLHRILPTPEIRSYLGEFLSSDPTRV